MKVYFQDLFEYNRHSNYAFLKIMEENQHHLPEKALNLQNHILNAHCIWNHRLKGEIHKSGPWENHPLLILDKIDEENFKESIWLLESRETDFKIKYTNSKGAIYQNTLKHVFTHIINHSTYHRGQIASILKNVQISPPVTDFIAYKR